MAVFTCAGSDEKLAPDLRKFLRLFHRRQVARAGDLDKPRAGEWMVRRHTGGAVRAAAGDEQEGGSE